MPATGVDVDSPGDLLLLSALSSLSIGTPDPAAASKAEGEGECGDTFAHDDYDDGTDTTFTYATTSAYGEGAHGEGEVEVEDASASSSSSTVLRFAERDVEMAVREATRLASEAIRASLQAQEAMRSLSAARRRGKIKKPKKPSPGSKIAGIDASFDKKEKEVEMQEPGVLGASKRDEEVDNGSFAASDAHVLALSSLVRAGAQLSEAAALSAATTASLLEAEKEAEAEQTEENAQQEEESESACCDTDVSDHSTVVEPYMRILGALGGAQLNGQDRHGPADDETLPSEVTNKMQVIVDAAKAYVEEETKKAEEHDEEEKPEEKEEAPTEDEKESFAPVPIGNAADAAAVKATTGPALSNEAKTDADSDFIDIATEVDATPEQPAPKDEPQKEAAQEKTTSAEGDALQDSHHADAIEDARRLSATPGPKPIEAGGAANEDDLWWRRMTEGAAPNDTTENEEAPSLLHPEGDDDGAAAAAANSPPAMQSPDDELPSLLDVETAIGDNDGDGARDEHADDEALSLLHPEDDDGTAATANSPPAVQSPDKELPSLLDVKTDVPVHGEYYDGGGNPERPLDVIPPRSAEKQKERRPPTPHPKKFAPPSVTFSSKSPGAAPAASPEVEVSSTPPPAVEDTDVNKMEWLLELVRSREEEARRLVHEVSERRAELALRELEEAAEEQAALRAAGDTSEAAEGASGPDSASRGLADDESQGAAEGVRGGEDFASDAEKIAYLLEEVRVDFAWAVSSLRAAISPPSKKKQDAAAFSISGESATAPPPSSTLEDRTVSALEGEGVSNRGRREADLETVEADPELAEEATTKEVATGEETAKLADAESPDLPQNQPVLVGMGCSAFMPCEKNDD